MSFLIDWMNGEQSVMYYLCNASNMCIYSCGCFGQLPFRQKGSDNFYTGLSPHQPCVSSGFVFSYDQDCSEDYLVTGQWLGYTLGLACLTLTILSFHFCNHLHLLTSGCVVVPDPGATVHAPREARHSETCPPAPSC